MATKNVNLENEAAVEMTEDEKKATVRKSHPGQLY